MISPTPSLRISSGLVRLGALLMVFTITALAGCSPTPTPTPTATPAFASEEEAFAAAEEIYRAFISKLNKIDLADPETFEPVFELSSGEFEAADRKAYSTMHAEGQTITGETRIISFDGVASEPPYEEAQAEVCLDVSAVKVVDVDGVSQVDPSRPAVYALTVTFVASQFSLTIDSVSVNEMAQCSTL